MFCMFEKVTCPVCLNKVKKKQQFMFPYCKHIICIPCGVKIMEHTPGQTNIRCPLCRVRLMYGLILGP